MSAHDLADPRLGNPAPVSVIDGATSYLGVRYAVLPGWRPLTLDLHLPVEADRPSPVVVYAHGGGFSGGTREMGPWARLPEQGFAVASIDYRLSGEARFPLPVDDVLAAIRWVRINATGFGLDANRIAGWGSSAGGYLMALAALRDEPEARLTALVLHYPLTDPARVESLRPFFEGYDGELAVAAHVRRTACLPPMHLSHGDSDRRCDLSQSAALHRAVLEAGGSSTLNIVAGADHVDPRFFTTEVVAPALSFLQEVLCASQI